MRRARNAHAARRPAAAHRRLARLAGRLACAATLATSGAAQALPADGSGNYTQILCANPSSNEGLGIAGMPEGLSNPADTDLWQLSTSEAACQAGPVTPASGIPMTVGLSTSYAQGTWAALLYQAPANTTINAGRIYRAERAEGPNNGFMGIDQQGGEYDSLYSLPRNDRDSGDWYAGNVSSRGSFAEPLSPANLVELTIAPDASHWDVNATCDPNGNNNSSCTLTAWQWEYRIYSGEISLHANGDPQASNISGTLTTQSPLTGIQTITFSATDPGPGLAYIKTIVDGSTLEKKILDSNGGHCQPVAGRDPYTWAYQVPCKTSLGGRTYNLDTTRLADGPHHIQILIEDAAGNQSVILDRTAQIQNTPPPAGPPAPAAARPPGAPNGSQASEDARVHIDGPTRTTRAYADSALTISGRLTGSGGAPIPHATLEVREQSSGSPGSQNTLAATTDVRGGFTIHLRSGPSRSITIGYRAHATDDGYSAQASVHETVSAGVKIRITPSRTGPGGKIRIAGHVAGPIPHHGVLVELLVHYRGAWVPFRTPRTSSAGDFSIAYQFQGATGRFPFRAQVPAGQAGFPYVDGTSRAVTVTSG